MRHHWYGLVRAWRLIIQYEEKSSITVEDTFFLILNHIIFRVFSSLFYIYIFQVAYNTMNTLQKNSGYHPIVYDYILTVSKFTYMEARMINYLLFCRIN